MWLGIYGAIDKLYISCLKTSWVQVNGGGFNILLLRYLIHSTEMINEYLCLTSMVSTFIASTFVYGV